MVYLIKDLRVVPSTLDSRFNKQTMGDDVSLFTGLPLIILGNLSHDALSSSEDRYVTIRAWSMLPFSETPGSTQLCARSYLERCLLGNPVSGVRSSRKLGPRDSILFL